VGCFTLLGASPVAAHELEATAVPASDLAAEATSEARAEPRAELDSAAHAEARALAAFADVPLGSLRFVGTHNSYHQPPRLFGIPFLPIRVSAKHDYSHRSLAEQLEGQPGGARTVRQLEIDVHMRRIGDQLRVFHLPWVDNQSSCKTFARCLEQVRDWSDARDRQHAPILIWIEPKDDTPLDRWVTLGWYERVDLMRVEAVILDVLGRDRVLAPDDARRGEQTLPAALSIHGWPTLEATRGKILFALLDEGEHRERYVATSAERNLEGRLMFVRSTTPDQPFAATFKVNNSVPTLVDLQAFGREMAADPELEALQVYPEPEVPDEPESALALWWKNLWEPQPTEGDEDAGAAEGDEAGPDEAPTDGANETGESSAEDEPDEPQTSAVEEKDFESMPKTKSDERPIDVGRQVRRELEAVHAETRAEARERHREAVAELEEEVRFADAPESEGLALVLENVRRSRDYREVFLQKLRHLLSANERAEILSLVRSGFLVTTTADDPRDDATRNRERALSALLSAAQFISTDVLEPRSSDGYEFEFPGDPILCNTLIDPDACRPVTSAPIAP